MGENWKSVEDFPNYEISNFGRIKRVERIIIRKGFPYKLPEKILKSLNEYSGYFMIKIGNEKGRKSFLIHRLVAKSFIENPKKLEFVNHLDNDKFNNHVDNLEWVNQRENSCHAAQLDKNSSSKFTGVAFHQKSKKWYASINYKGKSHSLGYHPTELEAYAARCKFEQKNSIVNKYL